MFLPSRRRSLHAIVVVILLAVASCAHQPDPSTSLPSADLGLHGQLLGFLVGLFHGFTMAFNVVASLFFDVRIYTFPNSGRLYDLGYVIGAAAFFGGSSRAAHRGDEADDD